MKKTSKFLCVALIVTTLLSCGSNHAVAQQPKQLEDQLTDIPCQDYVYEITSYLAKDIAKTESDIKSVRDATASVGRVNLLKRFEPFIDSLVDNCTKMYSDNIDPMTVLLLKKESELAVLKQFTICPITCWSVTPDVNGQMVWVLVEVAPQKIYQAMETVFSQSKGLKSGFDKGQFIEFFYQFFEEYRERYNRQK